MFAIALHYMRANRVALVRDHLGIKPLYYSGRKDRHAGYAGAISGPAHLFAETKELVAGFWIWQVRVDGRGG